MSMDDARLRRSRKPEIHRATFVSLDVAAIQRSGSMGMTVPNAAEISGNIRRGPQ